MNISNLIKNNSAQSDVFTRIVGYDYAPQKLDADIQTLITQDSYQPTFSSLMSPYLEREAKHFKTFFDGTEPFTFTVENLGVICNSKMQPSSAKIRRFLTENHIETETEKADFQRAVREEYFGSGFIHRYQTTTDKDALIYLYDMVETPFDTLYTFAHELTHAMQDKKSYEPYGDAGKTVRTDYREIHANLTAASFLMIKALQTQNPDVIRQTKDKLLWLSARMSNVMKTPKYGVRYFDWKGLNNVLSDLPEYYQNMVTREGDMDWNKLYTYTARKVFEMDYTPAKISKAKDFLNEKVSPLWVTEKDNRRFVQQIALLKGKDPIGDDFISGFQYFLDHPAVPDKKVLQFYQQLAKPASRADVLYSKMNDHMPNIDTYRHLDQLKKGKAPLRQKGIG